jgi:carbon starvation protein
VTAAWGALVWSGSIGTIWPMFGIANQILAVLALALVTTWLVNNGRSRYTPVTLIPMLFVATTTLTAAAKMVTGPFAADIERGLIRGYLNAGMTLFVVTCVCVLLLWAVARWVAVWRGVFRPQPHAN